MQSALYCSRNTEPETPKSLAAAGSNLASNESTLQADKEIGSRFLIHCANKFILCSHLSWCRTLLFYPALSFGVKNAPESKKRTNATTANNLCFFGFFLLLQHFFRLVQKFFYSPSIQKKHSYFLNFTI